MKSTESRNKTKLNVMIASIVLGIMTLIIVGVFVFVDGVGAPDTTPKSPFGQSERSDDEINHVKVKKDAEETYDDGSWASSTTTTLLMFTQ